MAFSFESVRRGLCRGDFASKCLDLDLPGLGGLEAIGRLKTADPEARVLVLSMHHDDTHVLRALQAGAAGHLSKTAPPDQILDAVERVADGRTYIEHGIAERLVFANIRAPSHAPDHRRRASV